MMRCPSFCLLATLLCVLISCCSADEDTRPLYEVDDVFGPELAFRGDREKKAVELKLASGFGIKNFLLDLVFGKVNQVIDYKTQLVKNLDRTNRYKNYYLLGLGTPPKGAEHPAQVSAAGSSTSVTLAEPRSQAGILTNAGGLGSAFGALTGLLGGLNVGVNVRT